MPQSQSQQGGDIEGSSGFSVVSPSQATSNFDRRRGGETHLQALANLYMRHSTATDLRVRVEPPPSQQTGTGRGTLVVPGWIRERAAEVLFEGGDVDESSVAEVILDSLLKVSLFLLIQCFSAHSHSHVCVRVTLLRTRYFFDPFIFLLYARSITIQSTLTTFWKLHRSRWISGNPSHPLYSSSVEHPCSQGSFHACMQNSPAPFLRHPHRCLPLSLKVIIAPGLGQAGCSARLGMTVMQHFVRYSHISAS